jgi:hypothetical protein
MSISGHGLAAVTATRAWLLEQLGTEREWTLGDTGDDVITWLPSALMTCFVTTTAAPSAPDLGVLRITTTVTTVGDQAAAHALCNTLNTFTTTNRWTIVHGNTAMPPRLQVSCSFVLGAHNAQQIAPFILACAREQIAIAAAKVSHEIAGSVHGDPLVYAGTTGEIRAWADWNRVTYHYDDIVIPNRGLSSEPLWRGLQAAFGELRDEMLRQGTAAWFGEADDDGFTCEMPFSWRDCPEGIIGIAAARQDKDVPPTVLVRGYRDCHPEFGNGVLFTMQQPVPTVDIPGGDLFCALNRLDDDTVGSNHSIGAWVDHDDEPQWVMHLPSVLAYGDDACDPAATWTQLLLTAAREALLARRALLPPNQLEPGESTVPVGLAASAVTHGLAWGETGEGA